MQGFSQFRTIAKLGGQNSDGEIVSVKIGGNLQPRCYWAFLLANRAPTNRTHESLGEPTVDWASFYFLYERSIGGWSPFPQKWPT